MYFCNLEQITHGGKFYTDIKGMHEAAISDLIWGFKSRFIINHQSCVSLTSLIGPLMCESKTYNVVLNSRNIKGKKT